MDERVCVRLISDGEPSSNHANSFEEGIRLIHLFYPKLWVSNRADLALKPWFKRKKTLDPKMAAKLSSQLT